MKKIFLLLSIFCTFLSACGSVGPSVSATPTSTPPPATATAQPATATEAATATATPIPFDWDNATVDERLEFAPISITTNEGVVYEKSNSSEVNPTLIYYRDGSGNSMVYNGKELLSLKNAGLIELDLNDGTKWERRAFYMPNLREGATTEEIKAAQIKTLEEMVDYMVKEGVAWGNLGPFTSSNVKVDPDIQKKSMMLNSKTVNMFKLPVDSEVATQDRFVLWLFSLLGRQVGSLTETINYKGIPSDLVFVDIASKDIEDLFYNNNVNIPVRPQQ